MHLCVSVEIIPVPIEIAVSRKRNKRDMNQKRNSCLVFSLLLFFCSLAGICLPPPPFPALQVK